MSRETAVVRFVLLAFFVVSASVGATTTVQPSINPTTTATGDQTSAYTPGPPPTYVIMAAQAIYPGEPFTVSMTILESSGPVLVVASLRGLNNVVLATAQTVVTSASFGSIVLLIPDTLARADTYSLVVDASGGLTFSKLHALYIPSKTLSIFVQTDKAIYTPSQNVLFRVLALHPDLTPYTDITNIAIYDPANNKLVQWLDQRNDNGVFSSSMPLSDIATPGKWTIEVVALDNTFRKTFEVAQIELSTFKVDVDLPSAYYVNTSDITQQSSINLDISAKHTYGSPVTGTAEVTITVELLEWESDFTTVSGSFSKVISDIAVSHGSAQATVTAGDLHGIIPCGDTSDDYYLWVSCLPRRRVFFAVRVTETSSKAVGSSNTSIQTKEYSSQYSLVFVNMAIFRPGLPVQDQLLLTRQNGQPLDPDAISNTYISVDASCYDTNWNYFQLLSLQLPTPLSGHLSFSGQLANASCVYNTYVWASFADNDGQSASARYVFNVFTSRDNEVNVVTLDNLDTTITAGSTVRFSVHSTVAISSLSYQLVSRGIMVRTWLLNAIPSTVHYLDIVFDDQLARELSLSARIIVWYVTARGELIADSLDFSVAAVHGSQVSVSFSSESVEPGQTVTVTVTADPGSYVGLLAVDQSAVKAPGNDITQETVQRDLFAYHKETRCLRSPDSGPSRRKRAVAITPSCGTDTSHVFFAAGVFVLTDAYIHNDPMQYGDPTCAPLQSSFPPEDSTIDALVAVFLETWLWSETTTSAGGTATLQVTVPSHVTSWMLTAFSISSGTGLGVLALPVNLTATKKFFVSGVAPFAVIRGEEFGLQVTVNNLASTAALTSVVQLHQSTAFRVRLASGTANQDAFATVEVPSVSSATTTFCIVPDVLGQIQLDITAVGDTATDAASVRVIVQPEGITQDYSSSVSASTSAGQTFTHTFNVTLPGPSELVPGSEHVIISAIGDFMGQTIDGLASLLQMPSGCGEQTMLSFAPDVYVLKYLAASNKLTADVEELALSFIRSGYQRELTYRHAIVDPYSFSAFGDWDGRGSVWLSAYVTKCFHQARDFIPVNIQDIAKTLEWLISNQTDIGEFFESGLVCHVDMQGLAANGKPLTAYVLISLLENSDNPYIADLIQTAVNKTVSLIESLLTDQSVTSDPYVMNLFCYALALAESTEIDQCLTALDLLATTTQDGVKYWQRDSVVKQCDPGDWVCQWLQWALPPLAIDVEMTAYALLTYTHLQQIDECSMISKWLMAQRNSNGGFISTQDTVVALQALAEYATFLGGGGGLNLVVSLTGDSFTHTFDTITNLNSLQLQRYEVPSGVREIVTEVSGTGVAHIQMAVKYHVYNLPASSKRRRRRRSALQGSSSNSLHVTADQQPISDTELELVACASWSGDQESGMVMMEIGLPTGYSAKDPEKMRGQGNGRLKKVETKADTKELDLYFDELVSTDTCVNVTLTKVLPVSNVQKARVTVYLYYEPAERTIYEYESVIESNETSYCEQCGSCCECNPPDYFQCDGKCFAAAAKCNGTTECSDKSDEIGCATTRKPTTTKRPLPPWKKNRRQRKLRRILEKVRRIRARRKARRAASEQE